jgi:hypothetical protein
MYRLRDNVAQTVHAGAHALAALCRAARRGLVFAVQKPVGSTPRTRASSHRAPGSTRAQRDTDPTTRTSWHFGHTKFIFTTSGRTPLTRMTLPLMDTNLSATARKTSVTRRRRCSYVAT